MISGTEHYPRDTDTDEDTSLDAEYANNPPEDYDYDLTIFRTEPCREWIEPLLVAFAKSLLRDNMLSLENAEVFTHLWWNPSDDIEVKGYGLPMGKDHRCGVSSLLGVMVRSTSPTMLLLQHQLHRWCEWQVGHWRPSEEVKGLFGRLGRKEWLNFEWATYREEMGCDLLGNVQSKPI